MATATFFRGTVIANNAAVSMAAGGNLEGRMLSTTGAVAFGLTETAFENLELLKSWIFIIILITVDIVLKVVFMSCRKENHTVGVLHRTLC